MATPDKDASGTLPAWLGRVVASRTGQAMLIVAVCAALFIPGLGATGLSMSEGHRAIPAWEMMASAREGQAHWWTPRMFETAYLRKPPGIQWAIASSTVVFGETEFAARFPSALAATLLALGVWWFATRWFGSPWGLCAGLAQALLPVTWPSARAAEIESLHLLTTGLASLVVLQALKGRGRSAWAWCGVVGALVGAMVLTKGPSGAPFVVGAVVAGCFVFRPGWARGAGVSAAAVMGGGLAAWALGRAWSGLDEPTVRQGVDAFLWEPSRLLGVAVVGPTVILTMFPASLALLFPWGPDAKRERDADQGTVSPAQIGRALGLACVLSLVVLTLAGVSNPRYGLPLCALVTPLVAYVAHGTVAFVGKRPAIARAMLGRTWFVWPAVLLVIGAAYVGVFEPDRRVSSGREAGLALAAHLPDGAIVWADEIIEARPEVLYYARREAAASGRQVRVRWVKPHFVDAGVSVPDDALFLMREDGLIDEPPRWQDAIGTRLIDARELTRGEVHKYTFVLVDPAE